MPHGAIRTMPFGRKQRGNTMGRRTGSAMLVAAVVVAVLSGATASTGATGSEELYVSDWSGGTIERVDTGSGTVGPAIAVGQGIVDVAITADGRTAYTVSAIGNAVVPVDLETSAAGTPIPVPCATNVAIVPGRQKAYVTQYCRTTVTPIDLSTNTAGTPITVGPGAFGVAADPAGDTVYVSAGGSGLGDALIPVDVASDTAGAPISLGSSGDPASVVVTPDGATAFVAMERNDSVIPVDLAAGAAGSPIAVSTNPVGLALTPDGTRLFVTHYQRGPGGLGDPTPHDVTPIDVASRTALPQVVVGSQTDGIAVSSDGTTAYVSLVFDTDSSQGAIVPIHVATGAVGTAIPVPGEPTALRVRPAEPADTTSPTLAPTVTGSGPGGSVLLNDPTAVAHANADDGTGSGVASSSCGTPDVSTVGLHTVSCTATDDAGNTSTIQATYVVEYRLVGLTPADGTSVRAGKPVKIAVSLADAGGAPAPLCAGCSVDVQIFAGDGAGPFAMTYHNGSGEYRSSWKPSANGSGTARIVVSVRYPGTTVATSAAAVVTVT